LQICSLSKGCSSIKIKEIGRERERRKKRNVVYKITQIIFIKTVLSIDEYKILFELIPESNIRMNKRLN